MGANAKLLALATFGLILTQVIPSTNPYSYLRLLSGIIFYLFLIGYIFLRIVFKLDLEKALLMSFPAGLMIQNFLILVLYNLVAPFFLQSINFGLSILLLNVGLIILVVILESRTKENDGNLREESFFQSIRRSVGKPIVLIVILGLSIRLLFQMLNTSSIMSDAALYCDSARRLVTSGTFSSSVLNDGSSNPYQLQYGLVSYPFTWFSVSLFFLFGEPTFIFAKLFVVFTGTMLVFPTYLFTKKLFDKPTAIIASLIVAVHPLFVFYSAVLYGPEITSLLFSVASIYFLTEILDNDIHRYAILAGLFASLAIFSWQWSAFLVYLASFTAFLVFRRNFKETLFWALLTFSLFLFLAFTVFLYPILLTLIMGLTLVSLRFSRRRGYSITRLTLVFLAVIGLISQLVLDRSYALQGLIIQVSREPSSVEAQIKAMLFPNLLISPLLISLYLYRLLQYSAVSIMIFAIPSIALALRSRSVAFLWSYLIILITVSALIIPPAIFTGTGFSFSRLLLAPTLVLSILAACVVHKAGDLSYWRKKKPEVARFQRRDEKVNLKRLIPIFLVIIVVAPFYYGYASETTVGIREANFLKYVGTEEAILWASKSMDHQSVMLSFDPRLTAWWFNITSAGLLVKNGTLWTRTINLDGLNSLFQQFEAKYLFLDPDTLYVSSDDLLSRLYVDSPSMFFLRELSKDILINSSIQSMPSYALLRGFKSISNPYTLIYEFREYRLHSRFLWLDDNFSSGWEAFRGSATSNNGTISLAINETEEWGMYASYSFSNGTFSISNSTFAAVGVTSVSEKTNAGIYILFTDGTEYTELMSHPGLYMIDLQSFQGKYPIEVYLYDLVVDGNASSSHLVNYDFISFLDFL